MKTWLDGAIPPPHPWPLSCPLPAVRDSALVHGLVMVMDCFESIEETTLYHPPPWPFSCPLHHTVGGIGRVGDSVERVAEPCSAHLGQCKRHAHARLCRRRANHAPSGYGRDIRATGEVSVRECRKERRTERRQKAGEKKEATWHVDIIETGQGCGTENPKR